jgi:hypothetical protein
VFTELPEASLAARGRPCASSWPAGELTGLGARAGLAGEQQPEPVAALELARRRARECGGVVLVAGSHYLAPVAGAG